MTGFFFGFLMGIGMIVFFALEIAANRRREERGEAPKKHHDITDWQAPVVTIDRTMKRR